MFKIHSITENEQKFALIKQVLKKIKWQEISGDWDIDVYKGRGYKRITLNPCLDCSKFKPQCVVHHINLDMLDNRLENLYPCIDASEHNKVHYSLNNLTSQLLKLGLMVFVEGKYCLAKSR